MKPITNSFKEQITRFGKEIDLIINVYENDKIITEDNEFLMTENNLHLVVEQLDETEIDETITGEDIYGASIIKNSSLLSTIMSEFDFEVTNDLRVGEIVDCKFGVKVGEEYEYIDYGKFIIYSKEKNEDSQTFSYVAFDSMLLSMVEVDDTSIIQGVSVKSAIENICNKVGLTVNITAQDVIDFPNLSNIINEEAFTEIDMTYRDVLDMICQCLGIFMISNNRVLYLKPLNRTPVDTIDEEFLKDINVMFSDKYMINSVVLSRSEDTDNIYRRDEESVADNGVHEFKIKDNLIMAYDDREDYIDEIYEQLNGLEFYINDFSSYGITYLDILDFYNVKINDKTYKCLLLNDEIKINQGLNENVYTDIPEETTTDYKTAGKTDKEVSFNIDKNRKNINAKVSQGDIIASLNLAIEDEQGIVEFKGNSIIIDGDNFDLDRNGNVTIYGNLITANGVLTNLIFPGEIWGLYFSNAYYQQGGGFVGFNYEGYGVSSVTKSFLNFTVRIPENFVVVDAKIHLRHSPVVWSNPEGTAIQRGSCQNLKVYNVSNLGTIGYASYMSEFEIGGNNPTFTEITQIPTFSFGSNNFETYSSDNFAEIFNTSGIYNIAVRTTTPIPATPSYDTAYYVLGQHTGILNGELEIIGYMKYNEEIGE